MALANPLPESDSDLVELTRRIEIENSADSYILRGITLYKVGRLEEAHRDFEMACGIEPSNGIAWYWLGCSHFASEAFPQSANCFSRALSLNKDCYWYDHLALGDALYKSGRLEEAIISYENAINVARATHRDPGKRLVKLEQVLREVREGEYEPELPEPMDRIQTDR